jgi:hypothetical protein
MTPKISLVTVVAVAVVAVPAAWGGQAPDAFERAVTAKLASQSLPQPNPRGMLASDSVESARQAQPFNIRDVLASDSVESAKAETQLINPRDVLASDSVESARAESQPINLREVLASDSVEASGTARTSVDQRLVADNYREPSKPVSRPTTIAASDSGREIEWSQIGMGFGLGILLAVGLFLAMRSTRIRQLAH